MTYFERFADGESAHPALNLPGLSLEERRVDLPSPFLKRALDVFIGVAALLLLLPTLGLIAIFIRIDSKGPVFFRQTRLGRNGKPFDILKFRSMHVLENGSIIEQVREGDPRVTRIGYWLRRFSLDELPQLFNVLSGEMSLVGPRPHALAHDRYYGEAIKDYAIRQQTKPGITGWAQIHGLRGPTPTLASMQARIDHDIWYVKNRRFLLDVHILVRTIGEVFRDERRLLVTATRRRMSGERRSVSRYSEVVVGGVKTARLSRDAMASLMVADCLAARGRKSTPRLIFTANGHSIALAATDSKFREQLRSANMIHADGQPVVWASKMTRSPIPERTATTDFIHDAAKEAEKHGLSFFLLGATEEVNARCAESLAKDYPGLRIAGRRDGYFSRDQEAGVCREINDSGADVIWVGLGVPLEQDFCVRNKVRLNAAWMVTSGGLFNFVAGAYTRAPVWMQAGGLEWLYRMMREPGRLFWRYATTNPLAIVMILMRTRTPKGRAVP